jgi:hypothetical protein
MSNKWKIGLSQIHDTWDRIKGFGKSFQIFFDTNVGRDAWIRVDDKIKKLSTQEIIDALTDEVSFDEQNFGPININNVDGSVSKQITMDVNDILAFDGLGILSAQISSPTAEEFQGLIDKGITVFYSGSDNGLSKIPNGTFELKNQNYFFIGGLGDGLGFESTGDGILAFEFPPIGTGPHYIKWDNILFADGTEFIINRPQSTSFIQKLTVYGECTYDIIDGSVYVETLNLQGNFSQDSSGSITHQYKTGTGVQKNSLGVDITEEWQRDWLRPSNHVTAKKLDYPDGNAKITLTFDDSANSEIRYDFRITLGGVGGSQDTVSFTWYAGPSGGDITNIVSTMYGGFEYLTIPTYTYGSGLIEFYMQSPFGEAPDSYLNVDVATALGGGNETLTIEDSETFVGDLLEDLTPDLKVNKDFDLVEYTASNGAVIKLAYDDVIPFYNDTGNTLVAGTYMHLVNVIEVGDETLATFEKTDASDWKTIQGTIGMVTCDVIDGDTGFVAKKGQFPHIDTSGVSGPIQIWLSATVKGKFTHIKPKFPNYAISVGGAIDSDVDGNVFVNITGSITDTFDDAWDGSIRETFNFTVSATGGVVTGLLENVNPLIDLTLLLSDVAFHTLDTTTTPLTILLDEGTDEVVVTNYVFIPMTTKFLTVNTTGFPTTEHCPIAVVDCQSASDIEAKGGARGNQNINNHLKKENNNGHLIHGFDWIRSQFASIKKKDGCEVTLDSTAGDGFLTMTSGKVRQFHLQTTDSIVMPTSSIMIANDPDSAFSETDNLNTITKYSDGTTWNNKWAKIVVWVISNKTGEPDFLLVNLPRSGYNNSSDAINDVLKYANYSMPEEYTTKAVLLRAFAINVNGGTLTYSGANQDLRGTFPSNIAGGGEGVGGVTSYIGLSDTPSSFVDKAGSVGVVNEAETDLLFGGFPIQLPELTTAERNLITSPNEGMIFRNITTNQIEEYSGGEWRKIGSSKTSPFYYGATGLGIADDTQAIIDCMAFSDTVDFTGGIFLCGDITLPRDNMRLKNGKLLGLTGASTIIQLTSLSKITNVDFQTTGVQNAVRVTQTALDYNDADKAYWAIEGCDFSLCYNGIVVDDNTGMAGGRITGNHFFGIEINGILIVLGAEYITVSDNIMSECKTAIHVGGGNVNINGNQITGSTPNEDLFTWSDSSVGIYIATGGNDAHGVISSNNINHCKSHGFYCEDINNKNMQISTNNFINSNIRIGNAGLIFTNNRFTTTEFEFVDTVGTRFTDSILDATPTISYSGTCDVVWNHVQTTAGISPTMPASVVINGGFFMKGKLLPLITGLDLDNAGSFEGYIISPVNAPESGMFWCSKINDDIQSQIFKPFNSSIKLTRDRNNEATWTDWEIEGNLTTLATWVQLGATGIYYTKRNGIFFLRGSSSADIVEGIYNIPAGFRPINDWIRVGEGYYISGANPTKFICTVKSDGKFSLDIENSTGVLVQLGGFSYPAEQ